MRRGTPVEVSLFSIGSQAEFEQCLSTFSADELLVIDLSVGSLEGFSAARQLASQLQIELAYSIFGRSINQTSSPSDKVAAWVDAEGRGDTLIAKAYAHAEALAAAANGIKAGFLIILPLSGQRVCEEDNWFIYFLAAALRSESRPLRILSIGELPACFSLHGLEFVKEPVKFDAPPAEEMAEVPSLVSILPGLLAQNQVVQLAAEGLLDHVALLPLLGGMYLIAPAHRRLIQELSDQELNVAQEQALMIPGNEPILAGLNIAKLERGLSLDCAITDLVAAAWRLCGEGGLDVAEYFFAVIAEYLKHSSYNDYLRIAVEMQSFRISAQRFDVAASLEEPDVRLGETRLCEDVFFTLGWARVLNGNSEGSADAFSRAGNRELRNAENAIDLYLLNIFALSLLRNGDWDAAMKIEQGIGKRLRMLPEPDWHLSYINNFNLARLYRMRGENGLALNHIRAVLETTEGLQTDSDHIYFNLTMGDISARRESHSESLAYLWRAALHFLCNPVPEAIGWRTLMSVLGRRKAVDWKTPELIAEGLCSKLEQAAEKEGLTLVEKEFDLPFYYSDQGLGLINDECWTIAAPQFGALIMSPGDLGKPGYDSPAYRRLRSISMQIFDARSVGYDIDPVKSVMFTPTAGVELPPKEADQRACLALKYGVTKALSRQGAEPNLAIDEAAAQTSVHLPPVVADVVRTTDGLGALVSFKRYKEALELRGWAPELIFTVRDEGPIKVTDALERGLLRADETGFRGIGHQLGRLESQGVITLQSE